LIPPQRSRVEGKLIVNYVRSCNCSNVPTHFLSFCILQFNHNYSRKTTTILRISVRRLFIVVFPIGLLLNYGSVSSDKSALPSILLSSPFYIAVCPQQLGVRQCNHHLSALNFIVAWPSGLCCRVLHWFIVESSGSVTSWDENSHPNSDALAMRRSQTLHAQTLHHRATQPNIFELQAV
jgi:hypothetical protein